MDFDDNILISGFENSNIGLFTINDVKLIKNLSGHSAGITGIKLNAQVFASSSYDGSVRLWSTKGYNLAVFEEPNELLRNEIIDFFFQIRINKMFENIFFENSRNITLFCIAVVCLL